MAALSAQAPVRPIDPTNPLLCRTRTNLLDRKLAAAVRMHGGAYRSPESDGISKRRHREMRLHPTIGRVADDPAREGVLDRAKVELALVRRVLGDVGEPQLVGSLRTERTANKVVVHRLPGSRPTPLPAGEDREDAVGTAEPLHTVLARCDPMLRGELVGDEPVAERRVVGVDSRAASTRWASDQSRSEIGLARHL